MIHNDGSPKSISIFDFLHFGETSSAVSEVSQQHEIVAGKTPMLLPDALGIGNAAFMMQATLI